MSFSNRRKKVLHLLCPCVFYQKIINDDFVFMKTIPRHNMLTYILQDLHLTTYKKKFTVFEILLKWSKRRRTKCLQALGTGCGCGVQRRLYTLKCISVASQKYVNSLKISTKICHILLAQDCRRKTNLIKWDRISWGKF